MVQRVRQRPAGSGRRQGTAYGGHAGPDHVRRIQEPEAAGAETQGADRAGGGPKCSGRNGTGSTSVSSPSRLLELAGEKLGVGAAEEALEPAEQALKLLSPETENPTIEALPALALLATINLELGNVDQARSLFLQSVSLDPEGSTSSLPDQVSSAEKFLWLAQLSEEGGEESVRWFQRGIGVLEREIAALTSSTPSAPPANADTVRIKESLLALRTLLSSAHCSIAETYMTDLSLSPVAETECEQHVQSALTAAPWAPEPLQTLANVRISQGRVEEAREALGGSLKLWWRQEEEGEGEDEEGDRTPDFPTRISLSRLLMEVGMEEEALGVVERLVAEEDQSVEAWYLGGWCLYLLGQKESEKEDEGSKGGGEMDTAEKGVMALVSSREWLRQSLALYETLGYEDVRLKDHAVELVEEINGIVGEDEIDGEEGEGESEEEEESDEEMGGT